MLSEESGPFQIGPGTVFRFRSKNLLPVHAMSENNTCHSRKSKALPEFKLDNGMQSHRNRVRPTLDMLLKLDQDIRPNKMLVEEEEKLQSPSNCLEKERVVD